MASSSRPSHTCAACGYPHLQSPQRSSSGGASHEICPCCGFEPGYTDDDQDISPEQWGLNWTKAGSKWFSKGLPPPKDWPPATSPAKPRQPRSEVVPVKKNIPKKATTRKVAAAKTTLKRTTSPAKSAKKIARKSPTAKRSPRN